jgi:IstB-like ATP binding protein
MMTSNLLIEEWGKLLSDVPAAGAILDRLLHHAEIIPINGILKRDVLRWIEIVVIRAKRLPGHQDADRSRIDQKPVRCPTARRSENVQAVCKL